MLAAGDIVLSLLFWGLANETTALNEAAVLYPLFGVGANIGQVCCLVAKLASCCAATWQQAQQVRLCIEEALPPKIWSFPTWLPPVLILSFTRAGISGETAAGVHHLISRQA